MFQMTSDIISNYILLEIAKNLMDILDNETIALKTGLSVEELDKITKLIKILHRANTFRQ